MTRPPTSPITTGFVRTTLRNSSATALTVRPFDEHG
jgi:hypothetical protein